MSIVKRIFLFFKNIFNQKEEVKMLQEPIITNKEEKSSFIESLKVNITKNSKKNNIETLVNDGDGLGIQAKISF
jgi:hypothetical protein